MKDHGSIQLPRAKKEDRNPWDERGQDGVSPAERVAGFGEEEIYKSSVLRCHAADHDCAVCRFIDGSRSEDDLMAVIKVMDSTLAEEEKSLRYMQACLAHTEEQKREGGSKPLKAQ